MKLLWLYVTFLSSVRFEFSSVSEHRQGFGVMEGDKPGSIVVFVSVKKNPQHL